MTDGSTQCLADVGWPNVTLSSASFAAFCRLRLVFTSSFSSRFVSRVIVVAHLPVGLLLVVVSQCEVKLLAFQIGLCHLDSDRVAQLIDMVAATADKTIVFLIEVVIIIVQIAHRNHAFAMVFVNLGINSVALYATDMCVEAFAQVLSHELDHLVFDGVAFGILSHLFHVRAMFALLFYVILVG